MATFQLEPHAVFQCGEVRCRDVRALRNAIDRYLAHRVLCVTGEGLPELLEDFEVFFRLPDGVLLRTRGRVIVVRDEATLIQVDAWSKEEWHAIQVAAGLVDDAPITPPPVAVARPTPVAPGPVPARTAQERRARDTASRSGPQLRGNAYVAVHAAAARATTACDDDDATSPRRGTMPSAGIEQAVRAASVRVPVIEVVSAPPLRPASDGHR